VHGGLLEDPGGGHIGQRSADPLVRDAERWFRLVEQVQCADRFLTPADGTACMEGKPNLPAAWRSGHGVGAGEFSPR
jgi:hypothetical protein